MKHLLKTLLLIGLTGLSPLTVFANDEKSTSFYDMDGSIQTVKFSCDGEQCAQIEADIFAAGPRLNDQGKLVDYFGFFSVTFPPSLPGRKPSYHIGSCSFDSSNSEAKKPTMMHMTFNPSIICKMK